MQLRVGFEAEFVYHSPHMDDLQADLFEKLGIVTDHLVLFAEGDFDEPNWYVANDCSIQVSALETDAEIIAPPQTVPQLLTDLRRVLQFIPAHGYTTDSTALHFTVSGGSPDFEKVVQTCNDSMWLRVWGRENNPYSACSLHHIMESDLTDKRYSVNRHNGPGVIEFKHIGGPHYEKRWPLIMLALEDFLRAYTGACS